MTFRQFYIDELERMERHPVRTPSGYWRWTRASLIRQESMSDLHGDIFDRLCKEADNRPAYLFATREKARRAAADAYTDVLREVWDKTPPAPEDAQYPEIDEA